MSGSPVVAAHRLRGRGGRCAGRGGGSGRHCGRGAVRADGVRRRGAAARSGGGRGRGRSRAAGRVRRAGLPRCGHRLADLLGWDRAEARRRVSAAEQVCPRTGLDGSPLPAQLPATAEKFAGGAASLRHVDVISRVLASPAARRLAAEVWAGAEAELAAHAEQYPPAELLEWGSRLVDTLDQDGPEPDDRPPDPVNELHLQRFRGRSGGSLKGYFDDAAMFDAIAAVVDAHARPADADDRRSAAERQAQALADACGYVLDHGDVPACGGRRPHLNVLVRLEDLENRARAACLDFGGGLSVESLRMLCCDAAVVPVVLGWQGPAAGRRAGHPRDPGGAAAGGRGARWRVRPLRPSGVVVRDPPRGAVGAGWGDVAGQHRHGVPRVPSADPPRGLGGEARRRAAGVLPAAVDRPAPPPPPPTTPGGLRSRRIGDPHPDRRPAAARARNSRNRAPRRCWSAPVDRRECRAAPMPAADARRRVGRRLQGWWRRVASSWRISSPMRPPPSGAVG